MIQDLKGSLYILISVFVMIGANAVPIEWQLIGVILRISIRLLGFGIFVYGTIICVKYIISF